MGLPEVTIGEIPGSGGTHRLANLIGLTRTKRMVYLGERVPAETALDWGILSDMAEDSEALDAHCKSSELADYKRPRDYIFIKAIPKSPVGKFLRRKLLAGEYEAE